MSSSTKQSPLQTTNPYKLGEARALAHRASQLLTKAARANLEAKPDDSHSNLSWDSGSQSFSSQPLGHGVSVSLTFAPLELEVVAGNDSARLALAGVKVDAALAWLDDQLSKAGLKPASAAVVPYALPDDVAAVTEYHQPPELKVLSGWFDLAATQLEAFRKSQSGLHPGPSAVGCWPHHFDIATYVSLEVGEAEAARGIGVGMSPGDDGYSQPYFYVNPWPHLDAKKLPDAVAPGHWHTKGYVGLIATAGELLAVDNLEDGLKDFISASFALGRKLGNA